ncbi:MAG: hypothetical protein E6G43_02980 [Actinobacteria bacterium]|nr:MAG: hypothetical protein E6G43_02980 [Actinomycetota bacterium]
MDAEGSSDLRVVAAETWRLMAGFTFTKFQGSEHVAILRGLGLTPGHMKALSLLDPDQPKPMRAMADSLACDAFVLTPLGIRTRERLAEALYAPPAELLQMDLASLEALRAELRKLPAPARAFWPGTAGSAERSRAS